MEGDPEVVIDEPTTETVKQEERVPTDNERMEHLYGEVGALRAEIAELRAHSHGELAHSSHEHEGYATHDHRHEISADSGHTNEPTRSDEPGGGATPSDSTPTASHPYFRRVKFGA